MKRIRFTELLANIRANIVAFLSIAVFVGTGMAVYLGIQWGKVALRAAVEDQFVQGRLHDIEIDFPYGITEDDLRQVRAVEGVTEVETGYSSYATMDVGGARYSLKLQSKTQAVDLPTRVEGAMPEKQGEAALLRAFADDQSIEVGDTLKLRHDATDPADADGMQLLTTDTLTVTGIVDNAAYLCKSSTTFGVSGTASGAIDGVAFLAEESFDSAKFNGGHSALYIRCASVEGLDCYSDAYQDAVAPILDRLTELGRTLGSAQYHKVHDDAEGKLSDAQTKIQDGERQLEEGKQKLEDSEKTLSDGEKALAEGKDTLASEQLSNTQQLDAAYAQLVEAQAKYDAGIAQYNTASGLYNELAGKFDALRGDYDQLMTLHEALRSAVDVVSPQVQELRAALGSYQAEQTPERWGEVQSAFERLSSSYGQLFADHGLAITLASMFASMFGFTTDLPGLDPLPAVVLEEGDVATVQQVIDLSDRGQSSVGALLDRMAGASVTLSGVTIPLLDIPGGLSQMFGQLESSRQTLESSKQQLDDGWATYDYNKALFDQKVAEGKQKLEDSQRQLEDGKRQLEEGKKQLEEKTGQLEEGKSELANAEEQFKKLVEYEWVVLSRTNNGGVQFVEMMGDMMVKVRLVMASLFVLVGLLVCYSAISRLVHEQIVEIGTKKAMGFRSGEITLIYLGFSGLATLVGSALSLLVATLVVQPIMNPVAAQQITVEPYQPYFHLPDLLVMGGFELVLILLSTWVAIRSLLRRNALELLAGEATASARERFYESWKVWRRMSFFAQMVINNCVNDPRRVVGTLVGVIGCTTLIVTAITLLGNVERSLARQYSEVYEYDAIAYLTDSGGEDGMREVVQALYDEGLRSVPVFQHGMQVRMANGERSVTTLVVPTNPASFDNLYHAHSTAGEMADLGNDEIWLCVGFGDHNDVKVGDEVTLTEFSGKSHSFRVGGFFEYYLMRQEFLLSAEGYEEAFGEEARPNSLLVDLDGEDPNEISARLSEIEGFDLLFADRTSAEYLFKELVAPLRSLVLVFLVLSALMALMVLLNLDVMFVIEKKRELIVLMTNGFSVRQAQAYIYRDSMFLTVIGIVLGIVVGSVVGNFTVSALEPPIGSFVKGFNEVAALAGVVGAAALSLGVLFYALGLIRKFDLTDISRI